MVNEKALAAIIAVFDITRYDPHFAAVDPGVADSNRFGAFYLEQSTQPGGYDRWGAYTDWADEQGLPIYEWESQFRYWIYENFWNPYGQAAEYATLADFMVSTSDSWTHLCWAFIEGNLEAGGLYPQIIAEKAEKSYLYAFKYWDKPITGMRYYRSTDSENYKDITRGDNMIYWLRYIYNQQRPVPEWFYGSVMAMIFARKKRRKYGNVSKNNRP